MFPNEKKNSGVQNREYFDMLANETIKLEIEIASVLNQFKNIPAVEMNFTDLVSSIDIGHSKKHAELDLEKLLTEIGIKDFENLTFVAKPGQLKEFQFLLSTYQPRDIADVLGWRALYPVLEHMPHRFRVFKHEFDKARFLVKSQRERCVTWVDI